MTKSNKMHTKHLKNKICPICMKIGIFKRKTDEADRISYYIEHYISNSAKKGHYITSHYLKKEMGERLEAKP
jgi:hypothetical protein